MVLNQAQLNNLASNNNVDTPKYDRSERNIGIVHIGLGAFHRSHQAYFTEAVLNQFAGDWMISAVSMRSKTLQQTLVKQDNLYTIAKMSHSNTYQVVGAIKEVLVASEQIKAVIDRLATAQTKVVTITVTEKGYCLNAQNLLDIENTDIQHDLAHLDKPKTVIGILVAALAIRKANQLPPLCIISCDNLPANGAKLKQAILKFSSLISAELTQWIDSQISFPSTMVDSITPQTNDATIKMIEDETGIVDLAPVQREAFVQWVIEDNIKSEIPSWSDVGVIFTKEVSSFEHAKLRILNGAHSALAYIGQLFGYDTVFEAINDQQIKQFIVRLLTEEVIPTITPPAGLNLNDYANSIIARFENPKIKHYLEQIACDGSIKVPVRTLEPIIERLAQKQSCQGLYTVVAAWVNYLRLKVINKAEINDPKATILHSVIEQFNGNAEHDIALFLVESKLFATKLINNSEFCHGLTLAYQKCLVADNNQPAL